MARHKTDLYRCDSRGRYNFQSENYRYNAILQVLRRQTDGGKERRDVSDLDYKSTVITRISKIKFLIIIFIYKKFCASPVLITFFKLQESYSFLKTDKNVFNPFNDCY